jgi:hypothetical protein
VEGNEVRFIREGFFSLIRMLKVVDTKVTREPHVREIRGVYFGGAGWQGSVHENGNSICR